MLELNGCIVTTDAIGCQKEIARGIVDRGADNMLAVEENEGQLHQGVWDLLEAGDGTGLEGLPHDHAIAFNMGHGRTRDTGGLNGESVVPYLTRPSWSTWAPPGIRSVVEAACRRETDAGARH